MNSAETNDVSGQQQLEIRKQFKYFSVTTVRGRFWGEGGGGGAEFCVCMRACVNVRVCPSGYTRVPLYIVDEAVGCRSATSVGPCRGAKCGGPWGG